MNMATLYFLIQHSFHEPTVELSLPWVLAADPLATGLAVADVDPTLLASVRQRMPIGSVSYPMLIRIASTGVGVQGTHGTQLTVGADLGELG